MATDFDGTLAPIVPDPDTSRPLPAALTALQQLVPRLLAVAVISGRSDADLARFLPVPGLRFLGEYGLGAPSSEERKALAEFNREVAARLASVPGVQLEAKWGSTSVHFRAAPESGPHVAELVPQLAAGKGLVAGLGRMVMEVRPERASKGRALARLVAELEPEGLFFAGDDRGDEPAFEYVSQCRLPHLAVGIESPEAAPGIFRTCDLVVDGPEEFSRLLSELAAWAARPGPARPGSAG